MGTKWSLITRKLAGDKSWNYVSTNLNPAVVATWIIYREVRKYIRQVY